MFDRIRIGSVVVVAVMLAAFVSVLSLGGRGEDQTASALFIPHESLVPDTAKNGYPIILGSRAAQVFAADQAGRHIVSGGSFTQIELQDGTILNQPYFAAWNIDTKQITCPNEFVFNDEVLSVEPGPTASQVFVGGRFTKVTGTDGVQRTRNKVALIDLADCTVDNTFVSTGANGKVSEIVLVGNRLFLGGDFNAIGGQAVETLAELDATTGVVEPTFDFVTTGETSSRIRGMGASADGTRLIFGGRFGTMTGNGQSISQPTGIIDISTEGAAVLTPHRSSGYVGIHDLQDVSVSPDGANIGLAFGTATVSDYVYLTPTVEAATSYTWVHYMRDSSFGVGVSNNAVYVSGHFCKIDSGPGATDVMTKRLDFRCTGDAFGGGVFRTQIAALSLVDGTPLTWNPGNDAGNGGRELTITTRGLLSGYDGNRTDGKRVGSLAFYDFGPEVEDMEPPQNVQFTAPSQGAAINNPAVIAGTAADNFGIVSHELAVQANDGRWVQADASLGATRHVFTISAENDGSFDAEIFMPAGGYTVEARAVDGAGLTSPDWVTRSFTQTGIEGVRPETSVVVPDAPVAVETRVEVSGVATDNVVVDDIDITVRSSDGRYLQDDRSLDDAQNFYPFSIAAGGFNTPSAEWKIDLGGLLPADVYTVSVVVTDGSGNTREETATFATTTEPPLAGEPAIEAFTGFTSSTGAYTMGYSFRVDEDTQVSAVGVFDTNGNGSLDNPAEAEVGVWRRSDQQLLGEGVVSVDAVSEGGWFYGDLDVAVELEAGVDYVVGYRQFSGGERWAYQGSQDKVDGFTIVNYAYRSINGFAYPSSQGANSIGYGSPNLKLGVAQAVKPEVEFDSPLDRVFFQDPVFVSGRVLDNAEVTSVMVRLRNGADRYLQDDGTFGALQNALDVALNGLNTTEVAWSRNLGQLPVNNYTLEVTGVDFVGNTTLRELEFTVTDVIAEPMIAEFTNFAQTTGNYTMGYTFRVDEDAFVHELGIFDTNGNGMLDNPAATPIGIWRRSNQALLVEAEVATNTDAESGFFWVALDEALELEAGVEYVVGYRMWSGGENWAYNGQTTVADENPGFTFVNYAYRSISGFAYPSTQGATQANSLEYGVPNLKIGVTPPAANLPPVVDPVADRSGTVDAPITAVQISAIDPENTELTFTVDVLPAGLAMDDAGRITGTPTTAGDTTSQVTVTDAEGAATIVSFDWTIVDVGEPGGDPCTATREGNTVVLVWEPIAGEDDKYQIRVNGGWEANIDFDEERTWTDTNPPIGATYVVRSREGGVNTDVACTDGGGDPPPPQPACTVAVQGGQVTLAWDPVAGENDNYQIRANDSWVTNVAFDAGNTWSGAAIAGADYVVRSREGGVNTDLSCG